MQEQADILGAIRGLVEQSDPHQVLRGDTIALSVTPEYLVRIGLLDKAPDILGAIRGLVEQSDPHQVLRGDGKRYRVADRLVETIVGAVAKRGRLPVVGALVKIVPEF